MTYDTIDIARRILHLVREKMVNPPPLSDLRVNNHPAIHRWVAGWEESRTLSDAITALHVQRTKR